MEIHSKQSNAHGPMCEIYVRCISYAYVLFYTVYSDLTLSICEPEIFYDIRM